MAATSQVTGFVAKAISDRFPIFTKAIPIAPSQRAIPCN